MRPVLAGVGSLDVARAAGFGRCRSQWVKPRLDVTIENIVADKNGRYIVAEATLGETKIVCLNIYAPNDKTLQVHFLRDLSQSIINQYANERIVLGDLDKRGGRSLELKKKCYQ